MNRLTITGRAILPNETIEATITLSGAKIVSVQRGLAPRADIRADGWIAPGLIDLQVNGAYGFDFSSNGASVTDVSARLPETGVTAFLPTVISSPLEDYACITHGIQQAASKARGAQVLGVHLEGPYLNRKRAGAHNPDYLRAPALSELDAWVSSPLVRFATLAPELDGALEIILELATRGIVVSAGHSEATYEQAVAGFNSGVTYGTHLFNAMSPLAHREPGLVGALLSSDVPCGLIADGVHVHPAAVRAAFRAKGALGITLVTDAMAAMGMSPGQYKLGDRDVTVNANSARLPDGTLAGSILRMDAAVRKVIEFTGCSLTDAIAMASSTPARVLGLERKGKIATDCDADLVVFDESLHVQMTIVAGEITFERKAK